jgi:hypothetical protein
MLRRLNTWVDAADMKKFAALAKKKKVKAAYLVRVAMAEYLERQEVETN